MNPYKKLPDKNFWKTAVERVEKFAVDPVVDTKFKIRANDKVVTAGSCFAQHIARELQKNDFNYYTPEQNSELSVEESLRRNYGVFSARYGNIYTVRQFLQLINEATNEWQPEEKSWQHPKGFLVDPYRPRIEPEGFADEATLKESRQAMLAAVRQMLNKADVLVFTLGLTEAWRNKKDGAVFPLAPGVYGGKFDKSKHEFVNFGISETMADLDLALAKIKKINPDIKVILTVSPVPLAATFEDRHVLTSNTYSKSVLRVAADEIARKYDWVQYFPSYEIITGNYTLGSYYEDDFREVNPAGVRHVMRCFLKNLTEKRKTIKFSISKNDQSYPEIVCDEEEINIIKA